MTTGCKGFAFAPAPSVIATTYSSITNCKDFDRHNIQCLLFSAEVEKVENRKRLDDFYCSLMVSSNGGAKITPAIGLQEGLTFVDSTFAMDSTNTVSVGAK